MEHNLKGLLMKITFLVLSITLVFSASCYASIDRILELGLFGITELDTLNAENKEFILNKIDSIRTAEVVDTFIYEIEVLQKYYFKDLPCIQLFAIDDGRRHSGVLGVDPYERFLYNACDSTFYPFGGGHVRFSKFIKRYLPDIIAGGDNMIKDLIYLYLNTLRAMDDYYILTSPEDFINLWQNWKKYGLFSRLMKYVEEDTIKEEIIEVTKNLRLFEILNKGSYYEVTPVIWDYLDGNIEWSTFRISSSVFEVSYRGVHLVKKGPYCW